MSRARSDTSPVGHPADVVLTLDDDSLQVRFVWQGDRFVHSILCQDQVTARSVDGDSQQAWPPSPPIQQLSLEHLGGQDVILGVGAAGKSHWSVCVEPVTDSQGRSALKFDWACRSSQALADLGTEYRIAEAAGAGALEFDALESCKQQGKGDAVVLCPSAEAKASTWQWAYQVRSLSQSE